jgi:hypothetical protein
MKKIIFLLLFFLISCFEKPLENDLFDRMGVDLIKNLTLYKISRTSTMGEEPKFEVSQSPDKIKLKVFPLAGGAHITQRIEFESTEPVLLKHVKSLSLNFKFEYQTSNKNYEMRQSNFDEMYPRVFFRSEYEEEWEIVADLNDLSKYISNPIKYFFKIDIGFVSGNPREKEFAYNETTYFISALSLRVNY